VAAEMARLAAAWRSPVTRDAVATAVRKAKNAGNEVLTGETGLIARMPIFGEVITYLTDEVYDARDAADTSRAERSVHREAQAYLQVGGVERELDRSSRVVSAQLPPRTPGQFADQRFLASSTQSHPVSPG
jgi:hypothetical protein